MLRYDEIRYKAVRMLELYAELLWMCQSQMQTDKNILHSGLKCNVHQ